MKETKKRCIICGVWYLPDNRTRWHQTCCGKQRCRKEQKRRSDKGWWARHPDYGKSRRLKVRSWAAHYPDYWQTYRQNNQDYRAEDNRRRKASHVQAKSAARQVMIRDISVERLTSIPRFESQSAAKQVVMDRRVDELVGYLLWRDGAAKQAEMELPPRNGP